MLRRIALGLVAVSVGSFGIGRSALAASYQWATTDGNWNTSGAWQVKVNNVYQASTAIPGDGSSGAADNANFFNGSTVTLNTSISSTLGSIFIGSNPGTSGTLNIATGASLTANGNTVVGGNNGDLTGTHGVMNQSGGTYTNTAGILFVGGSSSFIGGSGSYSMTGGSWQSANVFIGSFSTGIVSVTNGTLSTVNGGELDIGQGSASFFGSGSMNIGSGATIKASKVQLALSNANSSGTVTMTGGLMTSPTGGALAVIVGDSGVATFTQSGGAVGETGNTGNFVVGQGAGSSGTYNLSGTGTLTAGGLVVGSLGTGVATIGAGTTVTLGSTGLVVGQGDGNGNGSGNGTLTMTGGHLIATNSGITSYVGQNSSGSQAVFTLSGGTVDLTQLNVGLRAKGGRVNIIGSTAVFNAGSFNALQSTNITAFYLDNGGVTTINSPLGGTCNGTLQVGFKGGAALTAANSFTLIDAGASHTLNNGFDAVPNTAMWTSGRTAGLHAFVVTMAAASDKSPLDATNLGVESHFTATGFGHLTVSNVNVASPLKLDLDVDPGSGKSITDLVNYFNTNGLTATDITSVSPNGFDVRLTFASPTASTQYFGWDLSDFNSTATLSAVSVPEPSSLMLLALGSAFMVRRRRPVKLS